MPQRKALHDPSAHAKSNDGGARNAKRGERAIQTLGLRRDRVVRFERPVGLSVTKKVDGIRRVSCRGEQWANGAPHEARRRKTMDEQHCTAAVSISLDVQCARAGGHAYYIGIDWSFLGWSLR